MPYPIYMTGQNSNSLVLACGHNANSLGWRLAFALEFQLVVTSLLKNGLTLHSWVIEVSFLVLGGHNSPKH